MRFIPLLAALALAACAPTSPARGTTAGRTLVGAACEAPAEAPRPQLEVEALEGRPASWESLRGTPTLIDVWATWCSACRGTLRAVDEVTRSVPRDKLRVIALSVDRDRDDAQEWLADPLNVAIPQWERDPQGIYLGGNQMAMSPRGMAKFGELYRLGGAIDGKRLLPEEWVELSWKPQTTSPWSGEQYGYGWFISDVGGHELYYAWGYGGQMIYVVPDLELTVVMTSTTDVERGGQHIAALRSLLAEGIVPAAKTGGSF